MIYQSANKIILQLNEYLRAENIIACTGLGMQDEKGAIITKDLGGQFAYIGLTDTKSTTVYFRTIEPIQTLARQEIGSCLDIYEVKMPIYAIITTPEFKTYTDADLVDLLTWLLVNFKPIDMLGIENIQLELTESSYDFDEIYQTETNVAPTARVASLARVRFDLSFLISPCKTPKPTC